MDEGQAQTYWNKVFSLYAARFLRYRYAESGFQSRKEGLKKMTVYIVQEVLDKDGVPVHDTSKAEEFGERRCLYQVLARSERRARTRRLNGDHSDVALDIVKAGLNNFNPDEDYLLPIGAIKLVAAASAIVARKGNGRLSILVWDDWRCRYDPIEMRLWDDADAP